MNEWFSLKILEKWLIYFNFIFILIADSLFFMKNNNVSLIDDIDQNKFGDYSWHNFRRCTYPFIPTVYINMVEQTFGSFTINLPILTKLVTKHPWVKRIQVCSNEESHPFPRGDNYQIVKYIDEIKRNLHSRTTGPISTKFDATHP